MGEFNKLVVDDVMAKIGENIYKLRLKKGDSQLDMAYALETSTSQISIIENGKRAKLQFETLIKIANYFEVPLQTIIT